MTQLVCLSCEKGKKMPTKKSKKPEYVVISKKEMDVLDKLVEHVDSLLTYRLDVGVVKGLSEAWEEACTAEGGLSLQSFLDHDIGELGYVVKTTKEEEAERKSNSTLVDKFHKLQAENDKLREQIAKLKNKPMLAKKPAAKKAVKKTAAKEKSADG